MGTFCQSVTLSYSRCRWINKFILIIAHRCICSTANLTITFYRYMCIVLNDTILAATIDWTLNEGMTSNSHICLRGQGQRLNKCMIIGIITKSLPNIIMLFTWITICTGRTYSSNLSSGQHTMRPIITYISINFRQNTLTCTKDITREIGTARLSHLHVVRTDFRIALDGDITKTTGVVCQCNWWSVADVISCYRSNLTTAIDAASHFGITLNDRRRITTHQSRVTMRFNTLTGTKDITIDNRRTCSCFCWWHTISESYRHRRILFHSTNLTATIDVTSALYEVSILKRSHRAVSNDDIRIAICIIRFIIKICIYTCAICSYHGFLTLKCVISTLTTSEYITSNGDTRCHGCSHTCRTIRSTDIHKCITRHICQFTTTIDIFSDIGSENRLVLVPNDDILGKHLTAVKADKLPLFIANFNNSPILI